MKKMLFALLAITTLSLSSCSKEQRINRQMDGSWNATTVNDEVVPSGSTVTYNFSKDKKGKGTGSATGTGDFAFSTNFSYVIADEKLTVTTSLGAFNSVQVYTISEHSKKKLVLTDTDGEKTVLEAK